jgi:uncharacterized membrane protein
MEAEAVAAAALAVIVFLVMVAMVVEMPVELVKMGLMQPDTEPVVVAAEVAAMVETAQKDILDLCIGVQTKC